MIYDHFKVKNILKIYKYEPLTCLISIKDNLLNLIGGQKNEI